MRKKTMDAIRAHAVAEYPRECCGLVVMEGRREVYIPCANMAVGEEHFVLSGDDYAAAEEAGKVVAVVHSHPDYPVAPSEADRVACEAEGLPWYIVAVSKDDEGLIVAGEVRGFTPVGYQAPLLGRQFAHGVLDCYALVRDWYKRERGIDLPDFERTDGWWEPGREGDLYMDNYVAAGFRPLKAGEEIAVGDMIVMQVRSDRANHAGVFIGAEKLQEAPGLFAVPDAMLHHLYGRQSERVVYGGYWRDATRLVLRHKELDR
ncbi:phage tail protein [Bordetella avium]|uniref:C40 family peptidase n=1 Tax=Bordetella avium TaxID=521 RepID=UPI000E68A997|nr:C40 family peptidase [Bordetella avium]RIQ74993.1 phage tail protein [Bordetella avium]